MNGNKSTQQDIYKGVPQGSVLRPILFTLYVNDMPNATSAKPRLFAEDTCVPSFHANIAKLSLTMNKELNMLHEWLKANKSLVNTSKTNFSTFVPSKNSQPSTGAISMGDKLSRAKEIKYLGVIIDEKLSWSSHINKVKSEIIKFPPILAKLRRFVPKQCLLTSYDSLVTSKIGYGLEAYGSTETKKLNELQVLQNRILKTIHFKDRKYPTNRILQIAYIKNLT